MVVSRETSYFGKVPNLCPTIKDVTLSGYSCLSNRVDRKWLGDYGRTALKNWLAF